MGKFTTTDATTQYTDTDGDILDFFPAWAGDGVVLGSDDEVLVAKEDLVEFFERVAAMADMSGTFVPTTDYAVTTTATRFHCGEGSSAVSASRLNGMDPEVIRQVAANMLAIAESMEEELHEKAEEKKAAKQKKEEAHRALRTSEIALEALELYRKRSPGLAHYRSWDDTNSGSGVTDDVVKRWIEQAERKREESRPKTGDLVRVAADATTTSGSGVYFGRSVIGEVSSTAATDVMVRTQDPLCRTTAQMVSTKYVTVIARADELPELRDAVLLGLDYNGLSKQQQHLVDSVIEQLRR